MDRHRRRGVGFLLAALVVATYLGATFGVQTALLALAVAVVPLGIVIPTFLWLDRFESEPTPYLVGRSCGARSSRPSSRPCSTRARSRSWRRRPTRRPRCDDGGARRPGRRRRRQGGVRAPRLVVPAARVRRHHRRHGLRRGLRGRLRLHGEHPVPRPGVGRGWRRGAHRDVRRPVPHVAVRAPDVHGAHRDRYRRGRHEPHVVAAHRGAVVGYVLAVLAHALWNLAAVSGGAGVWSSTCSSRCRSSSPSWGSSGGPGATRATSSGSSCAPTPTPGGSRPRRWRCSRPCPTAGGAPVGARQHRTSGPAAMRASPGHRERARPAAPTDVPLGRRRARRRPGARAARGDCGAARLEFVGMPGG